MGFDTFKKVIKFEKNNEKGQIEVTEKQKNVAPKNEIGYFRRKEGHGHSEKNDNELPHANITGFQRLASLKRTK